MPPAVALAGAAVVGAGAQMISGNKAAKAQRDAAAQQVAEQRRQYDQTRTDFAPWRETGAGALDMLSRAYGVGGAAPDMTAFTASPGYQWRMDQGLQAIDRSRAARGLLNSGAADKSRMTYAQGLASSEFGDWWNRMAGLAGVGQSATGSTAAAGMNAANNISNAYQQAGNARASSYANAGGAVNSGINNVLGAYLYNYGGGFGR